MLIMSSKHFAPIVPRSPLHVCKRGKHWVPCPNSTTTENYFFRAAHTRGTRHRILVLRMRSINATYKFHTIGDERVKKNDRSTTTYNHGNSSHTSLHSVGWTSAHAMNTMRNNGPAELPPRGKMAKMGSTCKWRTQITNLWHFTKRK